MKKTYLLIIALLAVFGIGIFAFGYSGPAPKVVVEGNYIESADTGGEILGGVSSTDNYGPYFNVHGPLYTGGAVTDASSTLYIALTLTAKQICERSVITVNSSSTDDYMPHLAASVDITLPGTSTLFAECLEEPGSHLSFLFANLSPTAASTTQIVAGGGMDLQEADDGSDFNVEIGGLSYAIIEIWRMPEQFDVGNTAAAIVTVTEYSPAD